MLRFTQMFLVLLMITSTCFADEQASLSSFFDGTSSYDIEAKTGDWLTVRGQDNGGGGVDPSDPTQTVFHVMTEIEWTKLSDGEGDQIAFKVAPFIPLEFAGQKFLFNFEVPIPQYAGLADTGDHTGLGDTRLKFFWLIGTEGPFVRAVVPSFDAIAPTGDENKGLGGGNWILMPNVVFALQPAENLSIYPFLRYVHSDDVRPELVPGFPLPEPPNTPGSTQESENLRAFNLEVPIVFSLQNAGMDWIGVSPDYFQNFTGTRDATFTMKYDSGVQLSEKTFMIVEFWHPVAGKVTSDFTFKLKLDFYF